jgi:hypothetical protein
MTALAKKNLNNGMPFGKPFAEVLLNASPEEEIRSLATYARDIPDC